MQRTLSAGFDCWYAGPVGDSPVGGPGYRVRLPQKQEAKMSDHSLNPTPAGRDLAERTARLQRLLTCRLTTAEILYHMPNHPALLQSYVWQDYDLAPKFPGQIGRASCRERVCQYV